MEKQFMNKPDWGERVIVTKNTSGHGFAIGSIVQVLYIFQMSNEPKAYKCIGDTNLVWYLKPDEFQREEKKLPPLKFKNQNHNPQ